MDQAGLADLPRLVQMALNIGSFVTTLQSGKQPSPPEAAAIQDIGAEASRDLNLLETLYNEYRQAAHIADPVHSRRITAAVNLMLTSSLIPK